MTSSGEVRKPQLKQIVGQIQQRNKQEDEDQSSFEPAINGHANEGTAADARRLNRAAATGTPASKVSGNSGLSMQQLLLQI
ncbi:hypothetical protein SH139x_001076 [Planctomycetaceae bacterium SH139]